VSFNGIKSVRIRDFSINIETEIGLVSIYLSQRKVNHILKTFERSEDEMMPYEFSYTDGIQRWVEFYSDGIRYYQADHGKLVSLVFEIPMWCYLDHIRAMKEGYQAELDLPALDQENEQGLSFEIEWSEETETLFNSVKRADFSAAFERLKAVGENQRSYHQPVVLHIYPDLPSPSGENPSFIWSITIDQKRFMNGGLIYHSRTDSYQIHT
jgi:L-rhamnose mutarotase